MPIELYYTPGSAPARSVLLAIKAIGVDVTLKELDLMKGEHLTPEFIKLNPQHTIPTLNDNGFALNESRAILAYLSDKYAKDDSLYPKDPKKRAVVNQRLFFDIGTLYQRFSDCYYPVMFGGAPLDKEKQTKLDEALGFLDKYLEGSKFSAGDNITIADFTLAASISTIEAVGHSFSSHKNVTKYYANCKSSLKGYEEVNQKGADKFKGMYQALTKKS
uniref:Uncharacterized protein n=1 Tax=Clastoptera arizonana TaxID=38151 RepID=A0A1B6E3T1_9HEMI